MDADPVTARGLLVDRVPAVEVFVASFGDRDALLLGKADVVPRLRLHGLKHVIEGTRDVHDHGARRLHVARALARPAAQRLLGTRVPLRRSTRADRTSARGFRAAGAARRAAPRPARKVPAAGAGVERRPEWNVGDREKPGELPREDEQAECAIAVLTLESGRPPAVRLLEGPPEPGLEHLLRWSRGRRAGPPARRPRPAHLPDSITSPCPSTTLVVDSGFPPHSRAAVPDDDAAVPPRQSALRRKCRCRSVRVLPPRARRKARSGPRACA